MKLTWPLRQHAANVRIDIFSHSSFCYLLNKNECERYDQHDWIKRLVRRNSDKTH
jgi:hypothetical protein